MQKSIKRGQTVKVRIHTLEVKTDNGVVVGEVIQYPAIVFDNQGNQIENKDRVRVKVARGFRKGYETFPLSCPK